MANDLYDTVLREWIARRIKGRGHKDITRGEIRNPNLGIEKGFGGSDVTPADDPEAALMCEIKVSDRKLPWTDKNGWHEHSEHIYSMSEFLAECVAILDEIEAASTSSRPKADD